MTSIKKCSKEKMQFVGQVLFVIEFIIPLIVLQPSKRIRRLHETYTALLQIFGVNTNLRKHNSREKATPFLRFLFFRFKLPIVPMMIEIYRSKNEKKILTKSK